MMLTLRTSLRSQLPGLGLNRCIQHLVIRALEMRLLARLILGLLARARMQI